MKTLIALLAAASLCVAEAPDRKVVAGENAFGIRLYQDLARRDAGKNVFLSPSSIELALSMTMNGAGPATREGMAKALGLEGVSEADLNAAHAALMAVLANPEEKVKLSIANSLWARVGVPFVDDFMKTNQAAYQAEIESRDFADAATLEAINGWIEKKTNGRIKNMLTSISPEAILYLVNAIWFKGAWGVPFDPAKTKDRPFTIGDGTKKDVPMMSRYGHMEYLRGEGFQAVRLPYGDKGRLSMIVCLPDEGASLEAFRAGLSAEKWSSWMGGFTTKDVDLWLPRWKSEYMVELSDALKSFGMTDAFSPERADFSRMTTMKPVCISFVLHRTFVEVNEEGTEAAAATIVGMKGGGPPPKPATLHCDRPFFCAIQDSETGAILFMGSVEAP